MPIVLILQNELNSHYTPSETEFTTWINTTYQALRLIDDHVLELTIRIVDKKEGATLNAAYRNKPNATNVLSFPYDPIPGNEENLLGDLAICAPIVEEEAAAQHKPVNAHWAHLTIHGILHLFGYDHIQEEQANTMEQLEIDILKELGFANPYQETTV